MPTGLRRIRPSHRDDRASRSHDAAAKRLFDILSSATALVVLSPLLLVIAAGVKVSSTGPAFYRGLRTGRHGKPFRMIKLRTMVVDALRSGSVDRNGRSACHAVGTCRADSSWTNCQTSPRLRANEHRGPASPGSAVPTRTRRGKTILTVRPGITDLSSIRMIDLASHIGAETSTRRSNLASFRSRTDCASSMSGSGTSGWT